MSGTTVIEGCAIATVDDARREFEDGHLVLEDGRIAAVGPGAAPRGEGAVRRIDGSGLLATPALVNCHHHLYQSATRGMAQQATLFEWLVALYPVWAHIDEQTVAAAAPAAIERHHDASPGAMVRIALAPPSPFSVTRELMAETAELARSRGVRLHTHLAETREEEEFCLEQFGVRPLQYVEELGWLGDDVWLAHCVHLDDREVLRMGDTATGVAHCPTSNARLGAGIAPVRDLVDAGAAVGLGVDGAASNEAGELTDELRGALLMARGRGGPAALTAREALTLATRHGARCLGREDELGRLEVGALADVALWRLDDAGRAGIADPVAALVLGPPRPVHALFVNGEPVVEDGELLGADAATLAADLARESARLRERVR